jgi:tetratricopeptide (TPR) repeat protein
VRGVIGHIDVPDEVARPLAWSIGQYHDVKGLHRTGIAEIGRCIEQRPEPGPDLVALLTLQADMHLRLGETAPAARIMAQATALAADVGTPPWDDMGVVRTTGELALRADDDPERAIRLAESALSEGSATARGEARLCNLLAIAHHTLGDVESACSALDRCLRAEEAAGLETFLANTHGNYAEALMQLGDPVGAAQHQLAALESARSMGQAVSMAFACMVAARLSLEDGDASTAIRIQSGADEILAGEGYLLYAADEQQRRVLLERARSELSSSEVAQAEDAGRMTPIDQLADQSAVFLRRRAESAPSSRKDDR